MTQEIIDAVRDIEREKGIESGTLVSALQVPNRGKQQRTIEVYLALKERNEIKNRIVCTLLAGNVPGRSPTG